MYLEAINIARLRDDHINTVKKKNWSDSKCLEEAVVDGGGTAAGNGQLRPVDRPNLPDVRRLMWDKMQRRRKRGLCFNCDEKFALGHKCKMKQAFFIETEEFDTGGVVLEDKDAFKGED
ncbi:hypothetical protein ACS0TY_011615 [Phlomoides rotata]